MIFGDRVSTEDSCFVQMCVSASAHRKDDFPPVLDSQKISHPSCYFTVLNTSGLSSCHGRPSKQLRVMHFLDRRVQVKVKDGPGVLGAL